MKLNKIRTYNLKELTKEYKEKALKLKQYELDLKSGKEKDSAKVKTLRRDVARILTVMVQKNELEEAEALVALLNGTPQDKYTVDKETKEEKVEKTDEVKDVEETKEVVTKKEAIKK